MLAISSLRDFCTKPIINNSGQHMKKTLIVLGLLGSVAGVAQAQSAVTVYGVLDVGVSKATGTPTKEGAGDNNRLGFKGVEDLGGGLAAIFQAEIRFDPDTGTTEGNGTRPLFQGQSRVGLKGDFGQFRLGRGLTAMQESAAAFDPWGATRARGTFNPGIALANYISDPLNPTNATQNRFGNAAFYNSPMIGGFQGNLTVATKEDGTSPTLHASVVPVSATGTYNNGPISAMLAYERNAVEDKFWMLGGSYNVGPANLMASYAQTKFAADDSKTKGWLIGAKVVAGPGNVLVGYGRKKPDGVEAAKQVSVGYEYNLSKRTFLYADAMNNKQSGRTPESSINTFDVGIHHSF